MALKMDHGVDDFTGTHPGNPVVNIRQRQAMTDKAAWIETTGLHHPDKAGNVGGG